MSVTTMPTPTMSAMPADRPSSSSHCVSRCPSVAPENAPESTPTSVMPICTEERNLPGSAPSASALAAPLTPRSIIAFSRAGRDETMASSDIDRRPLTQMSTTTTAIST